MPFFVLVSNCRKATSSTNEIESAGPFGTSNESTLLPDTGNKSKSVEMPLCRSNIYMKILETSLQTANGGVSEARIAAAYFRPKKSCDIFYSLLLPGNLPSRKKTALVWPCLSCKMGAVSICSLADCNSNDFK